MSERETAKQALLLSCGMHKEAIPGVDAAVSGVGNALLGAGRVTYDTVSKALPLILGVTLLTAPAVAMGAAALHSKATSPGEMDSDEIQKRVLAQELEAHNSNLRRRQLMQGTASGRVPGVQGSDREVRL
jgi:hypothetical protein